jgi:hypothetical protein
MSVVQAAKTSVRTSAIVGALSLLTACDPIYGVRRDARLEKLPQLDCVIRVMRLTPGVATVDKMQFETGRELTLTGLHKPGVAYAYSYRGADGSHVRGDIQFVTSWRGPVDFSDTLLRMWERPPQEDVDATRPVMRNIETALSNQCEVSELRSSIRERCVGVKCPSGDADGSVTLHGALH